MKQTFISKFMKTALFMCLLLTFSLSAMSKSVSPYKLFYDLWQQNACGSDELSLITPVTEETANIIVPTLKKELKVKNDVQFEYPSNVGTILTTLLKEKYGKKSNVKNDFLSIQYSTNCDDFYNYLKKYPNSKYAAEAIARAECFRCYEMMLTAIKEKTRKSYEAFVTYNTEHLQCNYEGCAVVSQNNNVIASEITEWYAIADRSTGSNPTIYRDYESYFEKYGDKGMFAKEASDSIRINKDRFDWNIASSENTIAAYEKYIKAHLYGLYYWKANLIMSEMKLWEKAETSGKYEDYCTYYSEFTEGMYAEKAVEKIKQFETDAWNKAKSKNTLAAYEEFLKIFPSGYYASEAGNKVAELRLALYKDQASSFNDITKYGFYSKPGYSLICIGNVDKDKNITISLTGPTGFSKTISPGHYEWVKVKNGNYKVLVQASNANNWWGTAHFENGVYAEAWYSYFLLSKNLNWTYAQNFIKAVNDKADDETNKTRLYIWSGVK